MRKRILLSAVILLTVSRLFAQFQDGIQLGLNLATTSKIPYEVPTTKYTVYPHYTFNIGYLLEYSIERRFALQSGIFVCGKGYSLKYRSGKYDIKVKNTPIYIDVPLNVIFKFYFNRHASFHLFTGPYTSVAVTAYGGNLSYGNSADDSYKRMDFGWNIGCCFDYKGVELKAQYGLGLMNVYPTSDATVKHRVIGISLAYMFDDE